MREIAIKKDICVRKKPSTEATNIFGRSRRSTCSFGKKSDINQKSTPAPNERSVKRASGDIAPLEVKSLQTTILSPKIRYAVKQAKCPKMEFFSLIISNYVAKITLFEVRHSIFSKKEEKVGRFENLFYLCQPKKGKVQEWLNWPAWKASKRQKRFRGSNPLLSAYCLAERV